MVNAARISADFAWLERQQAVLSCKTGVELKNRSEDEFASVAVQGSKSAGFIDNVFQPGAQTAARLQKNEVVRLSFGDTGYLRFAHWVIRERMALKLSRRPSASKRFGTNFWKRGNHRI